MLMKGAKQDRIIGLMEKRRVPFIFFQCSHLTTETLTFGPWVGSEIYRITVWLIWIRAFAKKSLAEWNFKNRQSLVISDTKRVVYLKVGLMRGEKNSDQYGYK